MVEHFDPYSPKLFAPHQRPSVWLGIAGIGVVVVGAIVLGFVWGPMWVVKRYVGPVLGNNAFFIVYTFLHHTHAALPHYRGPQWTRLRGALATVDRSFGPWELLDHLHHRIGSTHVLHHFFSLVPHYHAEEASRAIRSLLGRYYLRDETPWPRAVFREFCDNKYVAPREGESPDILWFRKV